MMLLIELYVIGGLAILLAVYFLTYGKHPLMGVFGVINLLAGMACLLIADHIRILP